MELTWYDASISPDTIFKKQLKEIWEKNFPKHGKPWVEGESDDTSTIVYDLLVVFDDVSEDTGRVWDREVVVVGYKSGKYFVYNSHWQTEITESHVNRISAWCFMPDAPDDSFYK